MNEKLEHLARCIEFGKISKTSPYPPEMKDQDGADEITRMLLDTGVTASDILEHGLIPGMEVVGKKFRENLIFVPQVLMSAKAMSTAMVHLKPEFVSGNITARGTVVIGTVAGDLHDIGKNLVAMILEGNGYRIVDLGTDVSAEKFIQAIDDNPGCHVGLSALLTTTMVNMEKIVSEIKKNRPGTIVLIGGAPVTEDFRDKTGADFYSPDPQGVVEFLNKLSKKK